MSMMSGFGFSGIDPLGTIFESGNNYFWNSAAADDAYSRSLSAADYAYALHQKSLLESPAAMVKGLEAAGLNPILAANSSAGSFSSSVPALTQQGDGGHGGVSSAGDPLTIARTRASIAQAKSAADAQRSLTKVYDAQAERLRYMPLTESDNGGLSILVQVLMLVVQILCSTILRLVVLFVLNPMVLVAPLLIRRRFPPLLLLLVLILQVLKKR